MSAPACHAGRAAILLVEPRQLQPTGEGCGFKHLLSSWGPYLMSDLVGSLESSVVSYVLS